jgi:pyruvate/2-oxoglutarate dehydrogenase complex dihydrolipoamide dehydrogenase (E3) component
MKFAFDFYKDQISNGLFFKLRQAYPNPWKILYVLLKNRINNNYKQLKAFDAKDTRIIIVGLGPAAISCAKFLIASGFKNIIFVSKDLMYGGKCVNFGCMPSEFVFSLSNTDIDIDRSTKLIDDFVAELRSEVNSQISSLGLNVIHGEVTSVIGKEIFLRDAKSIQFDKLIIASGNTYNNPQRIPLNSTKVIDIQKFWSLKPGSNLIIYSKDNPSAISISQAALSIGLKVTLILSGSNPFSVLPSWKYLIRLVVNKGVNLIDRARLIRVDELGISYEIGAEIKTIEYDHLLITSKPEPNIFKVDNTFPSVIDIDLRTSTLPSRSDIHLIGDVAGFYTAAEAEEHARLVVKYINTNDLISIESLMNIPLSFHGKTSLAMIGKPWTLTVPGKEWVEVDFRRLGWTKIHADEGKLWYITDKARTKVDAIHICHHLANELISIASILISRPLSDPIWKTSFLHPSASEIFKLIE